MPLVLVYGVAPPGAVVRRSPSAKSGAGLGRRRAWRPRVGVGEEAGEAREAIEEFDVRVTRPALAAAEAAGVQAVVEVVDDRPAPALVAAADTHDAEVIVVGTWNESPLRGLLLGSVAHKLLHLSDRPVLCVPGRPDPTAG